MSTGISIGSKITIGKREWELLSIDRITSTFKAYRGNSRLWMIETEPKPRRCLVLKKHVDFEVDDIVELKAEVLHFNAADEEKTPLTLFNFVDIRKVRDDKSGDEAATGQEELSKTEDAGGGPEGGQSVWSESSDQGGQTVYGDGSGEESWPSPPGGCGGEEYTAS